MAALNSKFDILRGWPNSSAVQEDFVIGETGVQSSWDHHHSAGTWVTLQASTDGSMKTLADISETNSGIAKPCYLIIEGADDLSSRFSKRVTCLLGGGYVVRIPKTYSDADGSTVRCLTDAIGTYTVNSPVKVVAGELVVAATTALDPTAYNQGEVTLLEEREAIVGRVIANNAADNTIDVHVY